MKGASIFGQLLIVLAAGLLLQACSKTADEFTLSGNRSYLLPQAAQLSFRLDSTIYDQGIGGTEVIRSSHRWVLSLQEAQDEFRQYLVSVRPDGSSTQSASLLWDWSISPDDAGSISTLAGVSTLGLVVPFREGSTQWNPLRFADPELETPVAGEPVEIYKYWEGEVDSIGLYTLPDGSQVEAVWVSLADEENLIELRQVREVYGEGVGLLERHMRIFDTQELDANKAWEEKAEAGFSMSMVRL